MPSHAPGRNTTYSDMATAMKNSTGIITMFDFSMPFLTPSTMTRAHARANAEPYPNGAKGDAMNDLKNSPDSAAAPPIRSAPVNAMHRYALR